MHLPVHWRGVGSAPKSFWWKGTTLHSIHLVGDSSVLKAETTFANGAVGVQKTQLLVQKRTLAIFGQHRRWIT